MGNAGNIYQSIGVEPIINCRGTFTIIGGSVELPEVLEAMDAASGYFVQYDELAAGVGRKLADITGAEWGLVSAGCAAGIKHITAACVSAAIVLAQALFSLVDFHTHGTQGASSFSRSRLLVKPMM